MTYHVTFKPCILKLFLFFSYCCPVIQESTQIYQSQQRSLLYKPHPLFISSTIINLVLLTFIHFCFSKVLKILKYFLNVQIRSDLRIEVLAFTVAYTNHHHHPCTEKSFAIQISFAVGNGWRNEQPSQILGSTLL